MQITINGKPEEIPAGVTIHELIERKQISSLHIVIEYNKKIAKRDTWSDTVLSDGDTLEILKFVGGG